VANYIYIVGATFPYASTNCIR